MMEKDDYKEEDTKAIAQKWLREIKAASDEKWAKTGDRIVKRYKDERRSEYDGEKKYNILWANIQTMLPALYGRTPRAFVERRWKDRDPVSRTAATILERVLQYEIDHYKDLDNSVRLAVLDRLLPGRGVAWVRFETKEVEYPEITEGMEAPGQPEVSYECTPTDYVFWKDFRHNAARTWDEVTWVARRVYMSRDDGVKRFGEKFENVPLVHEPAGLDEMREKGAQESELDCLKKAIVWEIWDKSEKKVYWIAQSFGDTLDIKEDPYGLDGFWPCPKPLFATQTTDSITPIPDFVLYQDQANELDTLTNRISKLVEAVKVVGAYDASQPSLTRMLNGSENQLIPVDTWAAFGEKGGLKGTVDFLPLDTVIGALQACYDARERIKQTIYEITGLSDIIRGASVASETATAQQIKSQYASLRLKRMQTDVAHFCSEVLQIKGQIIADLYSPETLIQMSGIMGTDDAAYAEQAIALIKSEPARNFRIEVAADSLVEMDEIGEKQSRTEFMTAFGQVLQSSLPMVQQVPDMAPLVAEVLMFTARTFKGGRQLENALEAAIDKMNQPKPPEEPQPDPEIMKTQALMQVEQIKAQSAMMSEQMKAQLEQMRQEMELKKAQMQAEIDAMTKISVAKINHQASLDVALENSKSAVEGKVISTSDSLRESILGQATQMLQDFADNLSALLEDQRAEIQNVNKQTNEIIKNLTSVKNIVRGEDGKVRGVEINGVLREVVRGADGKVIGL